MAGPMIQDLPVVSLFLSDFKLAIVGIYRQHHGGHHGRQTADLNQIGDIIKSLSCHTEVCIAGDINLDAGLFPSTSSIPSPRRELFDSWLQLMSTNGLDLLHTGANYKSFGKYRGSHHISTLDQVYVSESIPARVQVMPDAATDHFPVVAELFCGKRSKKGPGDKLLEQVTKRDLTSIDRAAFRGDLKALGICQWPAPPPCVTVDMMIEDFYSVIGPVIDRHAPERTFKVRRDTPPLYLTKETREAMRMRDRARQGFGGDFKMLRNKCVKLVRRDRMQTAVKKMSQASDQQAAAWRLADSMLKRGNKDKLPLLKNCKSDVESAAKCNEFFLQKVENLVNGVHTSPEARDAMASAREFIRGLAFELNCVGIATTKKAIRLMGTTKAIGVDGLPCAFWKEYCDDLAPFVTSMINSSISNEGKNCPKK